MDINYQPLKDINDDKLGFDKTSLSIATFINDFPNNQPYSIALFGEWGSGKSSMLNFIEQRLDPNKTVVIKFNPWQILNEDNLVVSIFEEISHAINNQKFVQLNRKLLDYGRKVCSSGVKVVTKSFLSSNGVDESISDTVSAIGSNVVDSLFSSDQPIPLSVKKSELEVELVKWSIKEKKKIVIFIDEIDRLFPSEIIEIFKVIKATISFPSIFFVVAMDKSSVLDSLKMVNISRPNEYLIKIFQRCFNINTNYQLRTLFNDIMYPRIEDVLDSKSISVFKSAVDILIWNKNLYFPSEDQNVKNEMYGFYRELFSQLSEYISNPRTFINYIPFVLSNWSDFINQIDVNEENQRDIIAVYLIFTLYYINPDIVEIKSLGNRSNIDKKEYPELFKLIRYKLFNALYPEIRTPIEGKSNSVSITYDDDIIRKAIYFLKKYPDLKQHYEK